MRTLVDTCVWSLALRRKDPDKRIEKELADLISDGRALMIGQIRQELLSGIQDPHQFESLRGKLSFFEDIPLQTAHFEKAAYFCNKCRKNGIQGTGTDFLICSVATIEKLCIFTTDQDFESYKRCFPIEIYRLS